MDLAPRQLAGELARVGRVARMHRSRVAVAQNKPNFTRTAKQTNKAKRNEDELTSEVTDFASERASERTNRMNER